jgi:CDGSH-type Zn-finger protein
MSQSSKKLNYPAVLEMEVGTYYWCACGKSENQPFCNGSHQGSEFSPKAIEVKEKKKLALCQCKQSKNAPYCDGSHSKIEKESQV